MARKPPAPKAPRSLSSSAKASAIARLEARIKELNDLSVANLTSGDDPPVSGLEGRIRSTLAGIYGEDSAEYDRLQIAASLDATHYFVHWDGGHTPPREIQQGVDRGRHRAISVLQGEVDALKEDLQFSVSAAATGAISASVAELAELSGDIFVVHGRDETAKEQVAAVIQRAGLTPVILHQQANEGKTIIEKFEKHGSTAGFAVVIATPDDVGGLAVASHLQPELKPRARQNVIGEMFWFAGRLGRDKVCTLVKGDIDMPSDVAGVGYTPMDDHGGWKAKLLQELSAAGYKNLNWPAALV
jgi:predicted nucleotide-binding protein